MNISDLNESEIWIYASEYFSFSFNYNQVLKTFFACSNKCHFSHLRYNLSTEISFSIKIETSIAYIIITSQHCWLCLSYSYGSDVPKSFILNLSSYAGQIKIFGKYIRIMRVPQLFHNFYLSRLRFLFNFFFSYFLNQGPMCAVLPNLLIFVIISYDPYLIIIILLFWPYFFH
jgi:hypothetical protein